MSYDKKALEYMNGIEDFLKHNLSLGYIKNETTVEGLLNFINNIKTSYIPMMKSIEDLAEKR